MLYNRLIILLISCSLYTCNAQASQAYSLATTNSCKKIETDFPSIFGTEFTKLFGRNPTADEKMYLLNSYIDMTMSDSPLAFKDMPSATLKNFKKSLQASRVYYIAGSVFLCSCSLLFLRDGYYCLQKTDKKSARPIKGALQIAFGVSLAAIGVYSIFYQLNKKI